MSSAAKQLDHPLIVLPATFALAGLLLLALLWVETADIGPTALIMPFAAFASGALLFAQYASAAARWSGAIDPLDCMFLGFFGISFTLWGLMLLPLCGGVFGLLHAITCTAGIWILTREWRLAAAPLPALAPAWVVASIAQDRGWPPGEFTWMIIPILAWNIQMATVFTAWSAWRRRHPLPDPLQFCAACGYDLAGLHEPVCPECGSSVHLPQLVEPAVALERARRREWGK